MTYHWQSVRAAATAIVLRAGDVLSQYFDKPHTETVKSNVWDVVTEGDKASEAVIVPVLRETFPQFAIRSEEGMPGLVEDAEYTWYIDPIDGTTNFANNIPFFSISVGLADRYFKPMVGVVYNPVSRELFSAARGYGATLNDKPIRTSATTDIQRAVLSSGFPYDRVTNPQNNLREWTAMLMQARDLRRFGSAALELAFVAAGRLDGFWERHINPWDVQAGILLVQEAGGHVTDFAGEVSSQALQGKSIVATNGPLHEIVLKLLKTA
jgi:myo-inositol-1(or 4)-monophosphatase